MAVRRQPTVPDRGRWKPVVRAFPEDTEVLTEHGFLPLRDLHNMSLLGDEVLFNGNTNALPMIPMKDQEFQQWAVADDFPLIGTVDPVSGVVSYVKASMFMMYNYTDKLIHIKAKGVDILSSRFADFFLKPKYSRGFKFVLADNVGLNKDTSATFFLLDKYNQDLYGEYVPREGLAASLTSPITLYPGKHVTFKNIWDFFKYSARDASGKTVAVDRVRTEVTCYSLDVAPYHTLVIRRGRKNNNPRTLWVGSPVVVGDGSDKSLIRINAIKKVGKR
jgi:hypothetical protein